MKNNSIKSSKLKASRPNFLAASVAAALGFAIPTLYTGTVSAQAVEEIVVTGSRIVRQDFEANSPIVTVDSDTFQYISTVGVETALNQLPQFVPALTQFETDDVQATATNTPGASTVSLRGLGPNRNLVLLDGRRAMPVNASMAVDVNTIPSAAIERVEVITGGASSTYGADAVGGVVNFILKKDFEGADFDIQYGDTMDGGGEEYRFSGLIGANFADGRGNVMFGIEHANREPLFWRDRDFFKDSWADPTVEGTTGFYGDTAYVPGVNAPDQSVVDGIFNLATPGSVAANPTSGFFVNADGSVYTGGANFGNGEPDGVYRYNGPTLVDGLAFRFVDSEGDLEQNDIKEMASSPLERFSMFGRGSFDISDNISAFVQGNFTQTDTFTSLQDSPASNGWSVQIPYGADIYAPSQNTDGSTNLNFQSGGSIGVNCGATGGCTNSQAFPVTPELAQLLDSRADPDAPWQLNRLLSFLGPRTTTTNTQSYQVVAGISGIVDAIDGTWDASVSHGETAVSTRFGGFGSVERWREIAGAPNFGQGFFQAGNNGFGSGVGQCDTGFNLLSGVQGISQTCQDAITADLKNFGQMEQEVAEINLQGRVAQLPGGEMRFAAGLGWHENTYFFETDILTSQQSFLDSGVGLFPSSNSEGRTSVWEVYGELLVPVISDVTGIEQLNLELGYRYSDYNTVGGVDTYKALIDWSITESLRFRGGYQLANRAPNIGELFIARTQTFGFGPGDACSLNSGSPFSPNPAVNPDNAANAQALCATLMTAGGAADYYDPTQTQPGAFGGVFANTIGNPNLDDENAKTWTAGIVLESPGEGAFLEGLSLTLDWYQIEIEDMIAVESPNAVYGRCLGVSSNPTFDPNHPACAFVVRDPTTGNVSPTDVSYNNDGYAKTSGLDAQINWNSELSDLGFDLPGGIGVSFLMNYLLEFETQADPAAELIDWKGSLGPDPITTLQGGAYDYRTFTTFSYNLDNLNVSLRWRFLPEIDSVEKPLTSNPQDLDVDDSYNIFDLSVGYSLGDNYHFRFGIDNLLDKDPLITGAEIAAPGNPATSGQGTTQFGFYDVLGRRYYFGVNATF